MLAERLASYDPRSDDIIDHSVELYFRLRVVFVTYFVSVLVVIFMPSSFVEGTFLLENYKPAVITELEWVLEWATRDITNANFRLTIGSPMAVVVAYLFLGMLIAFALNVPFIFYQFYLFTKPGLYPHEQQLVKNLMYAGSGLFAVGALFGFLLMPLVTNTLVGFGDTLDYDRLVQYYDLGRVVEFLFWSVIATGLLFTYPIFVIGLVVTGVLTTNDLQNRRRHVMAALLGITMIVTPDPTPVSMIVLTVPLVLLYEITLNVAYKIEMNPDFQTIRDRFDTQIDKIASYEPAGD